MRHHLERGQHHTKQQNPEQHQAKQGSKLCSPYAQQCKERCCDKYGECPEQSGRACRYYYDAGKIADSSNSTPATPIADSQKGATPTDDASSEETAASTKTTTKITRTKKSSSLSENSSASRRTQPEESADNSEPDNKSEESGSTKSRINQWVQAGDNKSDESNRSDKSSRSSSKSRWALPSPFTPRSSVGIIFWILLGLGGLLLLFALYYCFCRRRHPTYYNPGLGGIPQRTPGGTIGSVVPGAQNMGAWGTPGVVLPVQPGAPGNMVQAVPTVPIQGSNMNPIFTQSAVRLNQTAPNGMPPVKY